ncbi:MAG: transcriptional regulator [Clostridia bacterium]|nr:transcriptional regulator [Clostridia bacterium]
MELFETIRLGDLLDVYGQVLTNKKREMLSMYVFDNMSYQEIAENLGISKPAVLDSIRVASVKLEDMESKLGFLKFRQSLQKIVSTSKNIKQDLQKFLKE